MAESLYGAIEAGGTKFVCAAARDAATVVAETRIETTDPAATLGAVERFFAGVEASHGAFRAFGVAAFGPVDLRRLVAGFLRMAPDVAIVGEVRDREALPLLLTLSSGVKGFTTIHAGSARQALSRLRFICQLSDTELPLTALNSLVTEAIDVVVHCARTPAGPRVTEVIAVEDLSASPDGTAFTTTEVFRRDGIDSPLRWSGLLPQRLERPLRDAGYDVRSLLDDARTTAGAVAP